MSTSGVAMATPAASTALHRHCAICEVKQNLLRCARCKVVQYCSKEHQQTDWAKHKSACTTIKKRRIELDEEEESLHATPDTGFMEFGDPFVTNVGHFWGLMHTRDYMRARYALVEAVLKVKTFDAVETALDHLMDMLRLCRSDNMGVRSVVPALLLRLGRDQECYDFVKWWTTADPDGTYDWGDTSLPYSSIKNADVFEPINWLDKYPDLSHTVSLTLIKIRQLLAVEKCLQNVAVLRKSKPLPLEMFDHIQDTLLASVLGDKWDDMDSTERAQIADTLSSQVDRLYKTVKKENRHFWPALLNPGHHLTARPEAFSRESVEEMQVVLMYSFDSWAETPGALEVIQAKT